MSDETVGSDSESDLSVEPTSGKDADSESGLRVEPTPGTNADSESGLRVEPTPGTGSDSESSLRVEPTPSSGAFERSLERPLTASVAVAGVVLLALLLRVPTLFMGLWFDECLTFACISVSDIPTLVQIMWCNIVDWHPPFYYVCLFIFAHVFGTSDVALRAFSLLCGLLLIPALYWLGRIVHSRTVGLLAGYFAAISYFANYMSCQTMPYSFATLLVAVIVIAFCKLTDETNTKKLATFFVIVFCGAALCYTEYSSIPLLPALGVATLTIYAKERWASDSPQPKLFENLKYRVAALFFASLLFVPWMPSLIYQKSATTDQISKTTPSMWPTVVSHNLMQMLPIPLIIGIPLVQLGFLALLIYASFNWKKLSSEYRLDRIKSLIKSMPSTYLILIWVVLLPSCMLGILTPFYMGYFRYTYCYSVAGWILLALMFYKVVSAQKLKVRKIFVPATLVSMLFLNVLYLCWFDSRPQSGLRAVAYDAVNGKYDNCTFMVVPSHISLTLNFYLPPEKCAEHSIVIRGFPYWSDPSQLTLTPTPNWTIRLSVEEIEANIEDLRKQGRKFLAVVREPDAAIKTALNYKTKELPTTALFEHIEQKYKKLSTKEYNGVTEKVTVTIYQLAP